MDFWSSLRVLAKRWYIVAIGLLVTVGGAVGVNFMISPSYTAAGSVVLSVPPNLPERAASANPYLAYGNLAVTAKVVASAMSQPSVVREQRSKGATGTFVVDLDPERSSPIITVDSQASTAAEAIRTVEVVTTGLQELLAERQRALGAPQNTWITANSVVVPEEANRAIGSRLRAISAILVLGAIATVSLAFAVEGWAQGRRRARTTSGNAAPQHVDDPPPPPPPGVKRPAPPAAPGTPVGVCPLCHAEFGTAATLSRHLEDEHDLSERPMAAPARRPPARRPADEVAIAVARRPRARPTVGAEDDGAAPAPKVRSARQAAGNGARGPTSPPPSR